MWQTNVPLCDKNWFKTGGPARFFYQPPTLSTFQEALVTAQQNSLDVFILGQGANILISDKGFDGLVINPQLTEITVYPHDNYTLVKAGAGISMEELISFCLDHNVTGLEEFSGIPSSVGGAVYINLHYFDFLLSDFLVSAQVIHHTTGEVREVDKDWFNFGYNSSTLLKKEYYLANATFKLTTATPEETAYAKGRKTEIARHRHRRYPTSHTCGSFFRNFKPNEVGLNALIYIAYYLDKIGVKGVLASGGARVSHQHANMLVNYNGATSHDIITLAQQMQQLVLEHFGLMPQPECQLIGFNTYPLLA